MIKMFNMAEIYNTITKLFEHIKKSGMEIIPRDRKMYKPRKISTSEIKDMWEHLLLVHIDYSIKICWINKQINGKIINEISNGFFLFHFKMDT